jgi:hypothetical protein
MAVHCPNQKFGKRVCIGLEMDVTEVRINGMDRHIQFTGNGFSAFRLGDKFKDRCLPDTQFVVAFGRHKNGIKMRKNNLTKIMPYIYIFDNQL